MHLVLSGPVRFNLLADLLDLSAARGLTPVSGGTPIPHLLRGLLASDTIERIDVVTLAKGFEGTLTVGTDRVRLHVGPYRSGGRARDAFRVERRYVRETIASLRPDVAHAHWTYEFALGALATDVPVVVTMRDWAPTVLRYYPDPYRLVRFGMNVVTLLKARTLTVPSPLMQRRLRRVGRRSTLVPNALPERDFAPRPTSVKKPGPYRLVAVNNFFSDLKNVGALIEAFRIVRSRFPDSVLTLVGEGHGPGQDAESWAAARGLTEGIDFVGHLDNASAMDHVASADLFVHPSLEESFGFVLLEAIGRGVPTVGGKRSGAVPWLLEQGRSGFLSDVRSPVALAATISTALADPDLRLRTAQRAHDRAWSHFRIGVIARQFEDLYRQATRRY